MGMIFRITGNCRENGEWGKPDPAFRGEVLIDDNNVLMGYVMDSNDPDINYREKQLIGALGITGVNKYGVAFYKISNQPYYKTKMYLVIDMEIPESAIWAERDQNDNLQAQGIAKIRFDKMPYSDTIAEEIKNHFSYSNLEKFQIEENFKNCAHAVATAC